MTKIFIYTTACKKRNLDAKKFYKYFSKNNYEFTNNPKEADYIIFFTCAFVNKMADRCLDTVKEFQQYDGELIVAGCLPDIGKEKLKKIFDGETISTKNLNKIDDIFNNKIKLNNIEDEHLVWRNFNPFGISLQPVYFFKKILKIKCFNYLYSYFKSILKKLFGRTWPFNVIYNDEELYHIQISKGCIHNCSYCAIRKAVGHLKSKSIEQCVKEFKTGLDNGYTDFILNADDVGIYGIDIKKTLPELLDAITKIKGDYNITLKNTHPLYIIKYADELEHIIKRGKIKHILISIQSGNNRILKLMRRHHTKQSLVDSTSKLKKSYPELNIEVELIIGFPTETYDEFMDTIHLLKDIQFYGGTITAFSLVDGTDAKNIEPKISQKEMKKRMRKATYFLKKSGYYVWYSNKWKGISFKFD